MTEGSLRCCFVYLASDAPCQFCGPGRLRNRAGRVSSFDGREGKLEQRVAFRGLIADLTGEPHGLTSAGQRFADLAELPVYLAEVMQASGPLIGPIDVSRDLQRFAEAKQCLLMSARLGECPAKVSADYCCTVVIGNQGADVQ